MIEMARIRTRRCFDLDDEGPDHQERASRKPLPLLTPAYHDAIYSAFRPRLTVANMQTKVKLTWVSSTNSTDSTTGWYW